MRTLSTQLGFLILGGAALVAAGSCARRSGPTIELPPHLEASEPDHFRAVRPMMGTFIDIEVPSKRSPELTAAAEAAFAAAARVDQEMNEWRPESQLSKVNAAAGIAPVKVDEDLFGLLETARRYGELTGGAFDVTWAAMRGVWKFPDDHVGTPPPAEKIRELKALVDYRDLVLDEQAKTAFLKRKGMAIGLGGIAKGYAVQRMVTALKERGVTTFKIQAGGDMYLAGKDWKIGIRDPRDPSQVLGMLSVTDRAINTSGAYEHFFEYQGRRYHHIIDPRTGMPGEQAIASTIVSGDATTGDALSKGVLLLGPKEGLALARKLSVEAVVVDPQGVPHVTPGLVGQITWREGVKAAE